MKRITRIMSLILLNAYSSEAGEKMPLPSVVLRANKIVLINETAIALATDKAYEKIKNFKRLAIVENKDEADLALIIRARERKLLGILPGTSSVNVRTEVKIDPSNNKVGTNFDPWSGYRAGMNSLNDGLRARNSRSEPLWEPGYIYLEIYARETKERIYIDNRSDHGKLEDRIEEMTNDFLDRFKKTLKEENKRLKLAEGRKPSAKRNLTENTN